MDVVCSHGLLSHSQDEQLVSLITKGNADDVITFLDSLLYSGVSVDHFRLQCDKRRFFRKAYVTTAAACGHVDIMDALILRGFSAEEQHFGYNGSQKPIHAACREGHFTVVKSLIENHNADVNVEVFNEKIPFRTLVSEGKRNIFPIAQYLVKRGADSGRISFYANLLVDSIMNPNATSELVPLLILTCGQSRNCGGTNPPPLHVAVDMGRVEFVKSLLRADTIVEMTSLYWGEYSRALPHRHHKLPRRNLPPGGSIQFSTFMRAASTNDLTILKVLYSGGADPNFSNDCGFTALHIAAARGFYDVARYLIADIGVALDKKDMFGETPLIRAAAEMHIHIVHLILKAGYNPKSEDLEFEDSDPIFEKDGVSELLQEVRQLIFVPRTLEELCIFRVRHLLCSEDGDLPDAVERLPLPNTLKNLIRLTHL